MPPEGAVFSCLPEFADRAVCIAKDLGETLETLRKACKNA